MYLQTDLQITGVQHFDNRWKITFTNKDIFEQHVNFLVSVYVRQKIIDETGRVIC